MTSAPLAARAPRPAPSRLASTGPSGGGQRVLLAQPSRPSFGRCDMCLTGEADTVIAGNRWCGECRSRYEIEQPPAGPSD